MGLKQDIVIVNEYTVPLPKSGSASGRGSAHAGSRGGTPGDYVLRYMARKGATEPVAPIRRRREDDFVMRYMARESAVESVEPETGRALKKRMGRAQGKGGVAFGYGRASLSHEALKAAANDIQSLFDSGHTVMKTVLSFDESFLRRHGLIPEGFVPKGRGDYRGHLDQMKLRLAVMHGLERMGRSLYDDLRYVAVAQVDTEHVHVHLAMADAGHGTVMPDGTQKGKISSRAKSLIRRGIDSWLDQKQSVKHLSSAVVYERRNVTTYVKRWAHRQMLRESLPQFLLSCLPADRRMWRFGSNAKAMRKPNRIVRELVEDVLRQPDSPYPEAMARVRGYADRRMRSEGLAPKERDALVERGRQLIVERGVNGVYSLLRQLPPDALAVRTPMLEIMGLDYESLAARAARLRAVPGEADLERFGFRLRSYSARLRGHQELREHYRSRVQAWYAADAIGAASPASAAMLRFYEVEESYHARVAAKYRSLLGFIPVDPQWRDEAEDLAAYGERILSLESLRRDQSLRKMRDPREAERIGRRVYGQPGGALVAFGDKESLAELDRRIAAMRAERARRLEGIRVRMAAQGMRLAPGSDTDISRPVRPVAGPEFPFEAVKALDLHEMRFDFARDVEVGARGQAAFASWAAMRSRALAGAVAYARSSGQAAEVDDLPVAEVAAMQAMAQRVHDSGGFLPSGVRDLSGRSGGTRRSATVRLGSGLQERLQERVGEEVRNAPGDLEADQIQLS